MRNPISNLQGPYKTAVRGCLRCRDWERELLSCNMFCCKGTAASALQPGERGWMGYSAQSTARNVDCSSYEICGFAWTYCALCAHAHSVPLRCPQKHTLKVWPVSPNSPLQLLLALDRPYFLLKALGSEGVLRYPKVPNVMA